jgi:hypothetical protein
MTRPDSLDRVLDGDDGDGVDLPKNWNPTLEIGRTGLKRAAGWVNEEFLPQLKGRKAVGVYREMSSNDPIVGSLLFALKRLMSEVDWNVEPASSKAEDRRNAEIIEQNRDDMSEPFSSFIMEALSSLEYGWSWHEICFKRRLGPWYTNRADGDLHRSKYDDGMIGLAHLPIRAQESWQKWIFDAKGNATWMVQMPAPDYRMKPIPRTKSLHFRPLPAKNNPEGISILRTAYRPWFFKKRMEETEAVGVERDLTGLPVAEVPADVVNARPGSQQAKLLASYKQMVRSVRRDENEGLVLPVEYDDKGNQRYKFSLLASSGSRQFDTNAIISRYEARILMTVLADFLLVGHEGVGSYNMHADKTGLFKVACNGIVKLLADELNRSLIPKLFSLNGMKPRELPRFVPSDVDSPDLAQLAAFMTAMGQLGITWFPDPKMEQFVRRAADLPELDKDVERVLEVQQRQSTVMQLAQQRLQALQIGQQAQQGEMQMQSAQTSQEQQAMQVETQRRELEKPGSTQPPQKAAAGRPAAGPPRKAAGRKVGPSNDPRKQKRKVASR